MLRRRRREAREAGQGGLEAFPGLGTPRNAEAARLRRRAADLEEADEILKKAAAIFAKSSPPVTAYKFMRGHKDRYAVSGTAGL
jgi:transposase-like protein